MPEEMSKAEMEEAYPGFEAYELGLALLESGLAPAAIEAFKSAGKSGFAQGFIELSCIERDRGNHQEAHNWLMKAETLAGQGDVAANIGCHFVYEIQRGEGSYEEQKQKSEHYLRRAAELGHPACQWKLAEHVFSGNNGFKVDENEYEKWIALAIEQGLDEAVIMHVENRLLRERDIEPDLMAKLEELAERCEMARKLLRKVKSGQKGI